MNNKTNCFEIQKQLDIKKEITKLNRLFSDMDKKYKRTVQSLIENAAFMAVTLRELQEKINKDGLVCEYQNGENQWGTKKSPEVEIYSTMIKNYSAVMKQLTDLLPKDKIIEAPNEGGGGNGQDFESFVSSK